MKPKRCTHEFSTPHIAREALRMMINDTANFGDLSIMKKVQKRSPSGKPIVNKQSGKPSMVWDYLNPIDGEAKAA